MLSLISNSLLDISFQIFHSSLTCNQSGTKLAISSQIMAFCTNNRICQSYSLGTWNLWGISVSSFPVRSHPSRSVPSSRQLSSPSSQFLLSWPWARCPSLSPGLCNSLWACFSNLSLSDTPPLIDPNISFSTLTPLAKNFQLPAGQSPCPWAWRSWAFRAWSRPF